MDVNDILCWSNERIYEELKSRGQKVGPIGASTKKLYALKLAKLVAAEQESATVGKEEIKEPNPQVTKVKRSKRASSIGAAPTRKTRTAQTVEDDATNGNTKETNTEKVKEKSVPKPKAPVQVQNTETPSIPVEAASTATSAKAVLISDQPKAAPPTAELITEAKRSVYKSNWTNNSGTPTRAEILRQSVQKRRSLHPDTPTVDAPTVAKKTAATKGNLASIKMRKFCTLSKLYIAVGIVLFFWLIYSVMESNPSNLSLL